ncbi:MAG: carbohydrate ABC transporter permease [Christensenellales bacterium]|jgi:sn-glycerol 3-phosphate transport system permease protein|nr:sugar ABC transporter permease [Clostridiales bacterium]
MQARKPQPPILNPGIKKGKKSLYEHIEPWLFMLPALLVFSVFLFYPLFKTIYLSAFLTNSVGQPKVFYGFKNYLDILTGRYSASFWNSMWVTLRFVFFVAFGSLLLGLTTSLLTSKKFPGRAFASAIYAMPIAIASAAAAMSFKMIFHPSIGLINRLFGTTVNWLNDPAWAFPVICMISIWLASGINYIFISAGLRNIPDELYESASIDGAGYWRQQRHITLPSLSPTLFFQIIINVIGAFQSFTQVRLLTMGGPNETTNVIVYSIYLDAFRNFRFGSAAARSIVLFVIIMIVTLIQFRAERKVHYQ